jgi:hypothetical protein
MVLVMALHSTTATAAAMMEKQKKEEEEEEAEEAGWDSSFMMGCCSRLWVCATTLCSARGEITTWAFMSGLIDHKL